MYIKYNTYVFISSLPVKAPEHDVIPGITSEYIWIMDIYTYIIFSGYMSLHLHMWYICGGLFLWPLWYMFDTIYIKYNNSYNNSLVRYGRVVKYIAWVESRYYSVVYHRNFQLTDWTSFNNFWRSLDISLANNLRELK